MKAAFDRLEEIGVIRREFRNIETNSGMVLNNVMYIDLCVDRLYTCTYLDIPGDDEDVENTGEEIQKQAENQAISLLQNFVPPHTKLCMTLLQNFVTPPTKLRMTLLQNFVTPSHKTMYHLIQSFVRQIQRILQRIRRRLPILSFHQAQA